LTKSIIVPIDGSAYAMKALKYAVPFAGAIGAEIVLLNVQPSLNTPNVKRFFSKEEIHEYQQQLGNEALAEAAAFMNETGRKYTAKIRIGVPDVEICNEAKERGAEGIFMGTRGRGPVRGALLGSVSYSVLHNAPCPVTVVP